MKYGFHARVSERTSERVTESPDAFYTWMENWKDRIEDREHYRERGSVQLPDFAPIAGDLLWQSRR